MRDLLRLRDIAVDDPDVRPALRRRAHPFEIVQAQVAVDALEDEQRPLVHGERAGERLDQAQRVLAGRDAEEIEHQQKGESAAGAGAAAVSADARHRNGSGTTNTGLRLTVRTASATKSVAVQISSTKSNARVQRLGKRLDLPEPVADRVPAGEECRPHVSGELRRAVGVHADDVDVVRHAGRSVARRNRAADDSRSRRTSSSSAGSPAASMADVNSRAASPMPSSARK